MLTVVMAQSSSDDNAIYYELPVLWMTWHNDNGAELKMTLFRWARQVVAKLLSTTALVNWWLHITSVRYITMNIKAKNIC